MYNSKYAPNQSTQTQPAPTNASQLSPSHDPYQFADPSFVQSQSEDNLFDDDVTYAEEFAQTRAPDDLFDDDFTPVAPETVTAQPTSQQPSIPTGPRGRGSNTSRGGRGRGRGVSNFKPPSGRGQPQPDVGIAAASDNAPATPAATQDRPSSVRGDRTLTGGVQKPKLSEEELTERMQQISLKNSSLLEAHARAEADAASFAEREARNTAQAAQRRKVDRVNRQQMMGERERNRQRKLDALGVREWDMEKKEEDFSGRDSTRGSGSRRGMHGGVGGVTRSDYSADTRNRPEFEDGEAFRGRGRGGRGRYGPRRGGTQRGDSNKANEQTIPTQADFPELPPGVKPAESGPVSKLSLPSCSKRDGETKEQLSSQGTDKASVDGDQGKANGIASNTGNTTTDSGLVADTDNQLKSPTEAQRSWADQVEAAGS
ncbi:hypothetical protein EV356DRAFT_513972 [Viridothelium virens]|uniref:Uncharacterized protein n=1 Tax=Viridothelium virens TaxID=1048519 RepID=A0A6A6HQH6_VIRVR|nr:hypothetical protein EV356DRAFT_513972 [Viridothelium virens]